MRRLRRTMVREDLGSSFCCGHWACGWVRLVGFVVVDPESSVVP